MSNSPNPLVTVVVPTFHRLELLPAALESIARQTWRPLQVIVVNDAGPSAAGVVDQFRDRMEILYIDHGENQGLAAARNTALRKAKGEWIAYLDDDDVFLPRHVETMVRALTTAGAMIGYADCTRVEVEPDGRGGYHELRRIKVALPFDRSRIVLKSDLAVQTVVHARSCLETTGLFDERLRQREDWELWVRMCRHWDFLRVPEVTSEYYYKVTGPSLSNDSASQFEMVRSYLYSKSTDLIGPSVDVLYARLEESARTNRWLQSELDRLRSHPFVRTCLAVKKMLRGGS